MTRDELVSHLLVTTGKRWKVLTISEDRWTTTIPCDACGILPDDHRVFKYKAAFGVYDGVVCTDLEVCAFRAAVRTRDQKTRR